MRSLVLGILLIGSGAGWAQSTSAEVEARRKADEKMLLERNVKGEGPALLQFFRERTLSKPEIEKLTNKITMLGTGTYGERQKAHEDLIKAGDTAKPLLCDALKNGDLEVVRRVELCLRVLSDGKEARLAAAAARLLAHHKPAGTVEVVLNYLPFATDAHVIEELQTALVAAAVRDGKPEPLLIAALTDARPIKRSAAAEALVRNSVLAQFPKIRELLKDPQCEVRAQVARVLTEAKDKSGVPVLIDLIADLPSDKVWQIEELLNRLAGEEGPNLYMDDKNKAAKVRDAWKTWWGKHGDKVNLAKLSETPPLQNLTLITQMGAGLNGRIYELKPNKEVSWEIGNIRYPIFSQIVGRDHILVCEYLNNKVTERDFKGNVVWEFPITMPSSCQRFPNGDTFITSRRQLVIVDKDKKEIFTHNPPAPNIVAAHRSRDGQIVLINSGGQCQRLDAKGNLIKAFTVGQVMFGGNLEVLPNGRILIPLFRDNKIVEYDGDGKAVWSLPVTQPTSVSRLPSGNYLIVTMNPPRVLELTREGREVWAYDTNNRLWSARKR